MKLDILTRTPFPSPFLRRTNRKRKNTPQKKKPQRTTMKTALALIVTILATVSGFVPKVAFTPRPSLKMAAAASTDDAKICLVTGSSQGIGKAIALELGRHGQKVVINHIKGCEEDAEATVEEVKALGGDAIAIEADCTSCCNETSNEGFSALPCSLVSRFSSSLTQARIRMKSKRCLIPLSSTTARATYSSTMPESQRIRSSCE
jgi:hypothetical protein